MMKNREGMQYSVAISYKFDAYALICLTLYKTFDVKYYDAI